ncbi:galactokinase family protein [Luteococcus peritonei]|uniref:Galactokinase family protein n=1 Tax=Luteococcus peritonei TaxID=88874 RepID=A0ABW4RY40_9ACTN
MSGYFSPGRIEVLGKHTDYAGGDVLVCAVDRGVTVQVEPAKAGITAVTEALPGEVDLLGADPLPPGHWGRYPRTVVSRLRDNFGELPPCRLHITSDLPLASGMSSSSAVVVATALALAHEAGLVEHPLWREAITDEVRLAGYLACIENGRSFGPLAGSGGVGTLGGSEDHTAMVCSRPGLLGRFSFSPPGLVERVELPAGHAFVVAVSGVTAEKTGAARERYNQASRATTELLERWNRHAPTPAASLAEALRSRPEAADLLRGSARQEPVLLARLEQFVVESTWCVPQAVEALRSGDLARFGAVVARSQQLAAEGLGNQVWQTTELVRLALEQGAVAASSFGAGFGGSVWALVGDEQADCFAEHWLERYRASCEQTVRACEALTGTPHTLVLKPSGPAHPVEEEQ